MQCSGMQFGTNAHHSCQHEGHDGPNVTLSLSLAFVVQVSAAWYKPMVEIAKLNHHHGHQESTSQSPNGSLLKHA